MVGTFERNLSFCERKVPLELPSKESRFAGLTPGVLPADMHKPPAPPFEGRTA